MSELDTKLAKLRDDLHTTITPPDLAAIGDRARHRTVRRRTQIGAVAAVVAVSVAVPLLRALPDAAQPPAQPAIPASMTFELDFADADHGYALGSDCEDPDQVCTLALFATGDGGRHWERRTLPEGDELFSVAQLTVIDENRLVVDRILADGEQLTRIVSKDRGSTWQKGALGGVAPSAPLPENGWLQGVCVGEDEGGCELGVGTPSQDGDLVVPAPAQPSLVEPQVGRVATEGGRFWATGIDRRTGRWAVSVSSDRGETWTTTPLTVPGEPAMIEPWAVVEHDGVMYVTLQGSIAKGPYGLLSVYRSTDDGLTWTNTWQATPETVLQAMLGSPVVTADGTLLVYSAAEGTFESADGGRTFTKAGQQLPGEVTWTRGGYVAKVKGHAYAISADGVEWRTFEIG